MRKEVREREDRDWRLEIMEEIWDSVDEGLTLNRTTCSIVEVGAVDMAAEEEEEENKGLKGR